MMRHWFIYISLLIFGCLHTVSPACKKRDVKRAEAEDSTRSCRKGCRATSDCSGALKKCECDDLCGLSCFNPDASCPNITGTLGNGTIKFSRNPFKYDSRASYNCDAGFSLRGVSARKCRSNRQWSHQPPVCIRSCPFPKLIGNSFLDTRTSKDIYEVGVTVSYKCQSGRLPSGNPNVTCQSSYTWSTLHLQCIRKDCGDPPAVKNGDYTPKGRTKFADNINYFCLKGFYTTDRTLSNWCLASGAWRSQPPTCKRVQCPPPISQLKNGKVSQNGGSAPWGYEDTIIVNCEDGYLINGKDSSLTLKCNENGTWGEMPSCKGDLNAEFNNELEGYTSASGLFTSRRYRNRLEIPDYGVFGSGVLRSVSYEMSSAGKVCMQVDIQSDSMVAQAISDNTMIDLMTFQATGGWRTKNFWLVPPRVNQTEVQLQFSAPMNSGIDNIKVVANSLCATLPLPKQSSAPEPPSTTKGIQSTTKKETASSTTTQSAGTTTQSASTTTQSASTTTQSASVTTQSTDVTTQPPVTTLPPRTEATTGDGTSTAEPDQTAPTLPGRNGRPGEQITTVEVTTTRPSPVVRNLLIGIGCFLVLLLCAILLIFYFRSKNAKPIDNSATTTSMVTTGSGANPADTAASNASPSPTNDKLIASEAV